MRTIKIRDVLNKHQRWLNGSKDGERADLSHKDLSGVNLRMVNLSQANLRGVKLEMNDLTGTNLTGADLSDAEIWRTNLSNANLRCADLCGASLTDSNLRGADLRGANLFSTNLAYSDLRGAKIDHAEFTDVVLKSARFYNDELEKHVPLVCPKEGSFIGYKKANDVRVVPFDKVIVVLSIPADAKRSSATTRKCRCNKAKVLRIEYLDGTPYNGVATSIFDQNFSYSVGDIVEASSFDDNRWDECAAGIHFFMTREEAVEYNS